MDKIYPFCTGAFTGCTILLPIGAVVGVDLTLSNPLVVWAICVGALMLATKP